MFQLLNRCFSGIHDFVFLPLHFNSNLHDHFDIIAYIVPLRTLFVVKKEHLQFKFTKQETITQPLPVLQLFLIFQFCSTSLFPSFGVPISKQKTTIFFDSVFGFVLIFVMWECLGCKVTFLIIQHLKKTLLRNEIWINMQCQFNVSSSDKKRFLFSKFCGALVAGSFSLCYSTTFGRLFKQIHSHQLYNVRICFL